METKQTIHGFIQSRLSAIAQLPEAHQKGLLAEMRHGIGKEPGDLPELWGVLFEGFPEEWMSKNGSPTRRERAVYLGLTLYALHQQGNNISEKNMNDGDTRFGSAVAKLAHDSDEAERIRKRFIILSSSSDLPGLSHYLRGMIQLLRNEGIGFDYPLFTEDLFWFQFPDTADRVRLQWGQDYYRAINNKEED